MEHSACSVVAKGASLRNRDNVTIPVVTCVMLYRSRPLPESAVLKLRAVPAAAHAGADKKVAQPALPFWITMLYWLVAPATGMRRHRCLPLASSPETACSWLNQKLRTVWCSNRVYCAQEMVQPLLPFWSINGFWGLPQPKGTTALPVSSLTLHACS